MAANDEISQEQTEKLLQFQDLTGIDNMDRCKTILQRHNWDIEALNDAKREFRFLLVYLHGDDHQDTPAFCRDTLANPEVVEYINARMLFWACNTNSPEGYRVSQALRENTYPFLALIVLRQNKMTVVARIEGPIGEYDCTCNIDERNFDQTLRREQDEAYLQSLRADQEKFLHYFAFCHEECPDDFHIVTNFPRKTLPCEPTDEMTEPPSFEEAGLGKNEMLFVQDNEA
ncbi:hypothetical protein KUTeg_000528 [Tegillarca granosa]|uniref:UAS domain-containing protein n=1 Tax=Tegillarca granosa TaxID=220873 RepID=A0ABQ9FXS6_TEGGR|nr:hypothetical protein KUTeg_000528 [Tegillarca granosa]